MANWGVNFKEVLENQFLAIVEDFFAGRPISESDKQIVCKGLDPAAFQAHYQRIKEGNAKGARVAGVMVNVADGDIRLELR